MKLSFNWLSEHVDLAGVAPAEVAALLTRSTCEVEGVEERYGFLRGVIAARIVKREQHPNADRLSLCTVETGDRPLTIVCGAPNAAVGLVVPLARVGTRLPGADGDFEIKPAKIRGVESHGMLCAARELELAEFFGESDGLLVLGTASARGLEPAFGLEQLAEGRTLADLLGLCDHVLEIDNKSITHRPDLWSHYGFAREVAMLLGRKLKADPLGAPVARVKAAKAAKRKAPRTSGAAAEKKIYIEKGAAKAYFGAVLSGVRVTQSPLWMRARLFSVGQRPINNLVDASNYMMLESGQPNHVFDLRRLTAETVSVERTTDNTDFTTLDGVVRKLPKGAVLIVDGKGSAGRPVALAGIMGGMDSAVADDTSAVFLESATFHREDIRRTLSQIPLRTDSAVRFEKGQDPTRAEPALRRLTQLIGYTCPDAELGSVVGALAEQPRISPIALTTDFVNARLGLALKTADIKRTLEKLGFTVALTKGKSGGVRVTAPSYRAQYDVLIPEDVVEEIGRVYGYDNIEARPPLFASRPVPMNAMRALERRVKHFISDAGGYFETNNYSFARGEDNELAGAPGILLKNPSFHDRDRLRVSLLPGLLRQVAGNQDRYADVRLFELGRAYLPEPTETTPVTEQRRVTIVHLPDPEEPLSIGRVAAAQNDTHVFQRFLQLRDLVSELLIGVAGSRTNVQPLVAGGQNHLHPGCAVEWLDGNGTRLATAGILHPVWEQRFDLKRPAVTAEIDLDALLAARALGKVDYQAPSQFPESYFELSLVLGVNDSTLNPLRVIEGLGDARITSVRLLGIYQGEQLPPEKKSASYRIACGSASGTLAGEEVQQLREQAIAALTANGMPLR